MPRLGLYLDGLPFVDGEPKLDMLMRDMLEFLLLLNELLEVDLERLDCLKSSVATGLSASVLRSYSRMIASRVRTQSELPL